MFKTIMLITPSSHFCVFFSLQLSLQIVFLNLSCTGRESVQFDGTSYLFVV